MSCTLVDLLPEDTVIDAHNVPDIVTGGIVPRHRVYSWMKPGGGIFGITLKSANIGGRRVTTARWLAEFLASVDERRRLGASQGHHGGPNIGEAL